MTTEQIYWWRDLLPEFLWIESLVQTYGDGMAVRVFSDFLSAADRFNTDAEEILNGTISAFRLVPENQRQTFRNELSSHITTAVERPFGPMLGLYSDCPMAWLSTKACPDHEAAVSQVRDAVVRLLPGKDDHTGFCRALPLHRMFAHNKVFIVDTMTELADAIEQYPYGDRWRVESFARQAHDTMFMQKAAEEPQRLDWSRGFWNSNLSIAPCLYE